MNRIDINGLQELSGDEYVNDPSVQKILRHIWYSEKVNKGTTAWEGGMFISKLPDGTHYGHHISYNKANWGGSLTFNSSVLEDDNTYGHIHSHPTNAPLGAPFASGPELSEPDKKVVRDYKKPIYTFSDQGIWKGYLDENGNVVVKKILNGNFLKESPCQ